MASRGGRRLLARWAKRALFQAGVYERLRRRLPSRAPVILRYHAVTGSEGAAYAAPGIRVGPAAFERQVAYLRRRYAVRGMDAVEACLRGQPVPADCVVLTFDDGYRDNLAAARVLHRFGCTAVFYVTTGRLAGEAPLWLHDVRRRLLDVAGRAAAFEWNGRQFRWRLGSRARRERAIQELMSWIKGLPVLEREDFLRELARQLPAPDPGGPDSIMLTWKDVLEMRGLGMEIGGHTVTHANLVHATALEAEREIRGCFEALAERLGEAPAHFAFPNGGAAAHYDARAKALVARSGFRTAVTSRPGAVRQGADPYELPRVGAAASLAELVHELEWWKRRRARV